MATLRIKPVVVACPRKRSSCPLVTTAQGLGCAEHGYHYEICVCTDCDLGISYPTIKDVSILYSERTSRDFQPDDSPLAKWLKAIVYQRNAKSVLNYFSDTPAVIADFGCGDGRFTAAMAVAAPQSSVIGIDFHATPPQALSTGPVRYLPLEHMPHLSGQCDVILLRHSLEHSNEPLATLSSVKMLLKPGGQLVIAVPNRKSPWASILGKYWEMHYMPYHRVHFSRKSLRETVENAGFRVVEEGGSEPPMMGRSLINILRIKYNVGLFVVGILLYPLQIVVDWLYREPAEITLRAIAL